MNFNVINQETWPRKEYFNHYYKQVKCTYNITANVDITKLYQSVKEKGLKLYPVLIWIISKAANQFEFMRFSQNEQGEIGYYDVVHPAYTYLPKESELFCCLWDEYCDSFLSFYNQCTQTMQCCGPCAGMQAKPNRPENSFDVSVIPWVEFTGFNLNLHTDGTWLLPIVTYGKVLFNQEKVLVPFSLQVHHSVCDGLHAAQIFAYLNHLSETCQEWIDK